MTNHTPGRLIIISGPSGVGKTTIVRRLLDQSQLPLVLSVSATTRAARAGEVDGKAYHFLSEQDFAARRERGEFLECCEVFGAGHWYGTPRDSVSSSLAAGKWVVLEIDVEGAMKVVAQCPEAITIFIRAASLAELERRLRGRGTETEQRIARRLEVAQHELAQMHHYRYQVVNETVDQTVRDICQLLERSMK